jgi:hypothetical protein
MPQKNTTSAVTNQQMIGGRCAQKNDCNLSFPGCKQRKRTLINWEKTTKKFEKHIKGTVYFSGIFHRVFFIHLYICIECIVKFLFISVNSSVFLGASHVINCCEILFEDLQALTTVLVIDLQLILFIWLLYILI